MFEKQSHVLVAMPFGDTGKVEIWTTKRDALSEKAARQTLKGSKGFKLLGLKRTRKAPPPPLPPQTKPAKKGKSKKAKTKKQAASTGKQ